MYKRCCFVNCSVDGGGGAIFFGGGSKSVSGCCFVNCSSGGAVYFSSNAEGSVTNSIFIGCRARSSGGAVDMKDGSVNYCIFENNTSPRGNAIYTRSKVTDAVNFNFFGFENNILMFPRDLIDGAVYSFGECLIGTGIYP